GLLPPQLDQPGGGGLEAPRAAQREPPLRPGRGHGHLPSPADVAEHVGIGDEHVLEEHLGEALVAVETPEAPHRDTLGGERHEEVGHPPVPLGRRVGAEEAEQVGAERPPGRPRLLAGETPPPGRLVPHGGALDAGQVAAGVALRPALAPEVLGRRHPGQDAVLLLLGAELEQRRGEQEDAVLGDALRTAGPVVLLLEEQPLDQARLAAAVLPRPRDDGPAGAEQRALPLDVQGEPLGGIARRQAARHVGLEPGPGLGSERLLLVGVGEVHYVFKMTQEPWPKRPWLTVRPTAAPSTWRPSAWPRSCQVTSHTWARAWA